MPIPCYSLGGMSKILLNEFLPYRINLTAEKIRNSVDKIYSKYDLDKSQWRIIVYMGKDNMPVLAREVRAETYLHRVAFYRALGQLEKKGIVTRQTDPNDRRHLKLKFTAKGQKFHNTVIGEVIKWQDEFIKNVGQDEINALLKSLQWVDENLAD